MMKLKNILWLIFGNISFVYICEGDIDERYFNLGRDAALFCSNLTWKETMFVTWKINLKMQHRECLLALSTTGNSVDKCGDGKSLRNTSTGQFYLHIPNVSINDVGIYKCENTFKGGNEIHIIKVDIRAPPSLSGWLESEGEKMVAVCRAERGIPAANISWSQAGSSVETQREDGGFFTVESRLELMDGADIENLTCSIKGSLLWLRVSIIVAALIVMTALFCDLKNETLRRQGQSETCKDG